MTEEYHQEFLERLDRSHNAVWLVAHHLWTKGLPVFLPQQTRAETHSQWRDHTDNGDLFVLVNDCWQGVGVKQLSRTFSRGEWPFRDVIVCATHAWDEATHKPAWFWYLSADSLTAAVLPTHPDTWRQEDRPDRRRNGYVQQYYITDRAQLHFRQL